MSGRDSADGGTAQEPRRGRSAVAHGARWLIRAGLLIWVMLGLVVALLIGLEGALRVAFWAKDAIKPLPRLDPRIVAEGYDGAAWVSQHFREDDAALAEWVPYVYFRHRPFDGETIHVGADGRRTTWNPPEEAAGADAGERVLRVWVLGGSTAWGMGARDEFTIPSLVSKLLHERGIRARVTNLAEIGYVSTQELIALELALRAGERPDVVIFLDGANEILAAVQTGVAGWPQHEGNRREEFASHRDVGWMFGAAARRWVQGSALGRVARAIATRVRGAGNSVSVGEPWMTDPGARGKLADEIVGVYAENGELIGALAERYGFRTRRYWQPTVFTKPKQHDVEREKAAQYEVLAPWVQDVRGRVGKDGEVVDLATVFDEEPGLIFWDFCHVTERGNHTIAEAIVVDLERAGLIQPRAALAQ